MCATYSSGKLLRHSLEGNFGTKQLPSEHRNMSSREYLHYFISYTKYVSINHEGNDNLHTSKTFPTRPDHILQMAPQSIVDDVTILSRAGESNI